MMFSVQKSLLVLIAFLQFFCVALPEDVKCPRGKPWLKRGSVCARVKNEPEPWRVADTNCRMTKGRTVQISNNATSMDEWLEVNRKLESSLYWIGAHVPALTLASYFDRCLRGYQRKGVCYQLVTSPMTWELANAYCSDSGGYIVHVDDEDTSRFVARVVSQSITQPSGLPPGYWIDGRSDEDLSVTFVDRDGMRLNYTNLQPSIVIDSQSLSGSACLEVLYKPNLPTTAPITDTTDYYGGYGDYDDQEEPDPAPLYNIQNCQVSRMFVCEYSLTEEGSDGSFFEQARAIHSQMEEGGGGAIDPPADNSHIYSPSRVRSCKEIVVLSDLAAEMRSNMEDLEESLRIEIPLLEMFIDVTNGFYIMSHANSGDGSSFELNYCNIDATRDELQLYSTSSRRQKLSLYLQMFRWSVFDYIDDSDFDLVYENENDEDTNQRLTDFNLFNIGENFNFIGPCVFMDANDGVWHTSPCTRSLPYICEYPPHAAKELEEKEEPKPVAEIERKITAFDTEFGGSGASTSPQAVVMALDVLDNIVEAGISQNGNVSVLSTATLDELDSLLQQALPIVDSLQRLDVMETGAMNSTNQFLAVQAVSSLAENLADKLTEVQNTFESTTNITQLNYKTNTSEVRIVLSDPHVNLASVMEALTFQPDQVETATRITMKPDLEMIQSAEKTAFIFAVHSATSSFYQQEATIKMAPSFITTSNGQTHIKLVRLDQKPSYRVGTPIITATLRMNGVSVPTPVQFNLPKVHFTDVLPVNRSEICSYLVYTSQETLWSDSGCHESQVEEGGVYQCSCNHTTDFAVLLLVYTPTTDELFDHRKPIFIFTLIGESLSVISLVATALTYYVLRNLLKSDRITVHLNLVGGLLMTHVTLLVGQVLGATEHQADAVDNIACTFLAFLLHFSLLSSFAWMLVEGFILYKKILIVLTRETAVFERKYYVIGWILPLMVVLLSFVICIGANIPYNDIRCWLSLENGVVWSFAAPATIIFMVNMVILVRVLCVAVATRRRRFIRNLNTNSHVTFHRLWHRDFKVAARGVIFLAPLLGVTWIFGFLVGTSVVCAYAFIFCNAFQGFYLFLFYVVLNPEIRSAWQEKQRLRERKFLNNADLPKLPPMERKSWLRRLSTSLMTRLSPTSASSSGSTSPSSTKPENRRNSNEINDFVPAALQSRPSSGKSISKHLTSLGVSMTSLRPKSGRVCPEVSVAMTPSGDKDADWVSVSESEGSLCNDNMDDVFCGAEFGVEETIDNCECLHHLSSGSCGSIGSHGGAKEQKRSRELSSGSKQDDKASVESQTKETIEEPFDGGIAVPVTPVSVDDPSEEMAFNEEIKEESVVEKLTDGRSAQQHRRKTKCGQNALVCQSRLCTICNKHPKSLKATGKKSHKQPKFKTRITSKRPATAGNNIKPTRRRGAKARQGKRNLTNTRLVLEAWSTKRQTTSLEVLSTATSQYAVDDLIGHLEYHASKVPANGRPQSSESHDSGIVMTP